MVASQRRGIDHAAGQGCGSRVSVVADKEFFQFGFPVFAFVPMKELYERLAQVLASIEPRNERTRNWLDRLILRCQTSAKDDLDVFAHRASIEAIRFDLQPLLIIQGRDEEQKPLYRQVESLLTKMEGVLPSSILRATAK